MSDLRDQIIRLAHNKPELRKHLLPLVREAADTFKCPECGTKVLEQTGYCVKCKKKVKKKKKAQASSPKQLADDIVGEWEGGTAGRVTNLMRTLKKELPKLDTVTPEIQKLADEYFEHLFAVDEKITFILNRIRRKSASQSIGSGKNGYIAMYKRKEIEVYADSSYKAQQIAAAHFGARRESDVTVILAEKDGKQVIHMPLF